MLRLAKRYVETGQGGAAWTELGVVILLQVSNWLFLEEKIECAVPVRNRQGASARADRRGRAARRGEDHPRPSARAGGALPAVCREEIKEGLVYTAGDAGEPGGDLQRPATDAFFDALALLLGRGVTVVVAEAAFQHRVWVPRLEPLPGEVGRSLRSSPSPPCRVTSTRNRA
ncbi:MAG TPA: hypothetical protein VEA16_00240 [Vicinamibacterales bacterium]|nr:hypothetical protein [Vicinamibacterales bacterium]